MKALSVLVIVLIVFLLSGIVVAYGKNQIRKLNNQLATLQKEQRVLQQEWHQLRLEHSALAATAVIYSTAQRELNMYIPPATLVEYSDHDQ